MESHNRTRVWRVTFTDDAAPVLVFSQFRQALDGGMVAFYNCSDPNNLGSFEHFYLIPAHRLKDVREITKLLPADAELERIGRPSAEFLKAQKKQSVM